MLLSRSALCCRIVPVLIVMAMIRTCGIILLFMLRFAWTCRVHRVTRRTRIYNDYIFYELFRGGTRHAHKEILILNPITGNIRRTRSVRNKTVLSGENTYPYSIMTAISEERGGYSKRRGGYSKRRGRPSLPPAIIREIVLQWNSSSS